MIQQIVYIIVQKYYVQHFDTNVKLDLLKNYPSDSGIENKRINNVLETWWLKPFAVPKGQEITKLIINNSVLKEMANYIFLNNLLFT